MSWDNENELHTRGSSSTGDSPLAGTDFLKATIAMEVCTIVVSVSPTTWVQMQLSWYGLPCAATMRL